jgi:hypothetical protein
MNTYARSSEKSCATAVVRLLAASLAVLVIFTLSSVAVLAQCTLNGVTAPASCNLVGPLTINTYSDTAGNLTTTSGVLTDNGTMSIVYAMELVADTSLVGPGVLTLNNGQIGTNSGAWTLTNASTIDGWGVIGSNGITYGNMSLNNTGTINANSSGNTLSLVAYAGTNINSGTMEATNGGILTLATTQPINNNGGTIAAMGANSVVNMATVIQGGTLTTSGGGVMQTAPTGATLDASTHGAITLTDGSTYTAGAAGSGTVTAVTGTLNLGTVSGSTLALGGALELTGDTTIVTPGSGSITMNNGQIGTNSVPYTLTNTGLIQGWGVIGSNATTYGDMPLNNTGTINANSTGNTLSLVAYAGTNTNSGTMEATNGGILSLATTNAINNNGGTIAAAGANSVVNVSTIIQGGTLSTSGGGLMQTIGGATLDALTQGAITLSDGSTYTAGAAGSGTITYVTGTLNLGTVSGSTLALGGALELIGNTTIAMPGSGSVTMNNGQIGTNSVPYTLTNPGLIQGWGVIGSNATTYGNMPLNNTGTINANVSGKTLSLLSFVGPITNAGLFEATNGGTLNLQTTPAINNQNGVILAGNGSTVDITNVTIQGGKLTTHGTGLMQTNGGATLDASSLGAITLTDGSTYTAGAAGSGTITAVTGTLNLGTVTGSTLALGGALELIGDTTVVTPGSGSVTMANAQIGTNSVNYLLTNSGLIQGWGVIGSNVITYGDLSLNNPGTINANSSANTLSIQGNGNSIVNTGLFEATNGGILSLATTSPINNAGGNITAAGAGSTVNVSTSIQGGTLNTSGGGVMQTVGGATLDAVTNGAITISDGSTYTAGAGTLNLVLGTLNLGTSTGGTLALSGNFQLVGNVTLSGPGSLTMSGNAQIGTNSIPYTLTNNSTIQGTGLIGSNIGALYGVNNVTNNGVILSSGGTMTLGGTGTLTNTGTLHATAGTTLISSMSGLSSSTFTAPTLLTGTYIADAGATIQINQLGTTGGEIVNNSATIVLNGVGSAFLDGGGQNTLSNFNNNNSTGSFTILNGRNFTSPGSFANAGAVHVGSGSTFTTGGSGNYNQSAGSTQLNGTLTAGGGSANFNGGVLFGNGGVVNGNVIMAGTIAPAATINGGNVPLTAGQLNINGNYTQTSAGVFNLGLGGLTAGSQFGFLGVSGNALINGTLNVNLLSTFFPAVGDTFTFLTTGGSVSGTFAFTNGLNIGGGEILNVIYGSNFVELSTAYLSTTDLWNGGTGVWSNGSQWSIGVPQPAFDTIIYSGGNDRVTLNMGNTTVNSLTVGGPTNSFTSVLTDGGVAQVLNINNALTVGQNGVLTLTGGSTVTAGASSSNAGAISIGTGSTFSTSGAFNQSGGSTKLDGSLMAGGNVFINGGKLLGNGGTVTGNVTNAGTISPGDTAGTAGKLAIVGNYVQTSAGIFQLDIGGLTAGTQFDLVAITQMATLSGTLDISLINSFIPSNGEIFTFLTAGGGVSGIFGTTNGLNYGNGHFTVIYNANNVELAFTGNQQNTPEPGTFLLLGSGLLSMAYGVRRRWQK